MIGGDIIEGGGKWMYKDRRRMKKKGELWEIIIIMGNNDGRAES